MPCACAGPKTFTLADAAALKVGQTKSSEYERLFGEPRAVSVVTTAEGTFQGVAYAKVVEEFSGDCLRVLVLEFKDGLLNGYLSASSCSDDATRADTKAALEVRKGMGRIARDEVAAALGQPSGKARCPSRIADYEPLCEQAAEVWGWLSVPTRGVFGSSEFTAASVTVSFDGAGKPLDVRIVERSRKGR